MTKEEFEKFCATNLSADAKTLTLSCEEMSGEKIDREGCLSFPEIFVAVKRADKLRVRFINLDSKEEIVHAEDLLARVVQHEIDHLNGILLVDRMSLAQKAAVAGKLKRLKKH